MSPRTGVPLLLLLGILGCSTPQGESASGRVAPLGQHREAVGRALALALADSGLRGLVHDAMRASPLVDHRLPFETWLATPEGAQVAGAMARQSGLGVDSIMRLVHGLAPLDLYFPSRRDRATWTAGAIPLLIVEPGTIPTFIRGFDVHGTPFVRPRGPEPFPGPALMLQASEGRDRRAGPRLAGGAMIQDPREEGVGGTLTIQRPGHPAWRAQLADLGPAGSFMQLCPPGLEDDCAGGGGGGSIVGGGGVTSLNGLSVNGVDDNGIPLESNEFEFRATAYIGLQVIGQATLRLTGVDPDYHATNLRLPLLSHAPDNYAYLEVDVVETDGWPNADDHFDYIQYQPNRVFARIPLHQYDQGRWWPLKEQPRIGVFDPEKVLPQFTWVNQ